MEKKFKCPVCGKRLTEVEFDQALGLWQEKQEHIKHLEAEQKKLKEQEKRNKKILEAERKRLQVRELQYKKQAQQQAANFKKEQAKTRRDAQRNLVEQAQRFTSQLGAQRRQLEKSFNQKMKVEIRKGVEKGVAEQRDQLAKQSVELRKSKNKMTQLENSLRLSARKYDQASEEIKKLKEQIQRGITPQIEGLLEEANLLAKLEELFPHDRFDHPGKGGDIIQVVVENEKDVGIIVYECKKVKKFDKKHVEQARQARNIRHADFAVLVTNAFPSKKQFYFVEKTVFVISPVSLEPITYTLRESLVKIALLKLSNAAKDKAVQRVYDFLSSNEYNNKMNDVANQLMELGRDLKKEIVSHKNTWEKRYGIYRALFNDIGMLDGRLKDLVHNRLESKQKLLPEPRKHFPEIKELNQSA